jgi:hypothetical protein
LRPLLGLTLKVRSRFGLCKLQTSFGWRNWGRGIPNTQIIFPAQRLSLRKGINDVLVRLFEDEDLSVTLVSDRRQFPALLAQII